MANNIIFPHQILALKDLWRGLSLSAQFASTGGVVMLIGMVLMGFWVTEQITAGVTKNSAASTARYIDAFIAPLAQELDTNDVLSIGPIRALDELLKEGPLGKRVVSIKIWKKSGLIAYSGNRNLIGKSFPPSLEVNMAWNGDIISRYNMLDGDENILEQATGLPLIEIYSPIRAPWSGQVIAVAEFYVNASELASDLAKARIKSWMAVALVTLAMAVLLMGIVHRGSRTIEEQREALQRQLISSRKTSDQNQELRLRVERASARITELNEQYLKRISAELHDGPAQLLSLASLRIESLKKDRPEEERNAEFDIVRTALDDAMKDIRNLCRGLTLPDIAEWSLVDIIQRLTATHEERTGTRVRVQGQKSLPVLSHSIKICIYRFVQEGLNNAHQHADSIGQAVKWEFDAATQQLFVQVEDKGPGIDEHAASKSGGGLGLEGLRERIESIGGTLKIDSQQNKGTRLTMQVFLRRQLRE